MLESREGELKSELEEEVLVSMNVYEHEGSDYDENY